jgi:hypothetical protein
MQKTKSATLFLGPFLLYSSPSPLSRSLSLSLSLSVSLSLSLDSVSGVEQKSLSSSHVLSASRNSPPLFLKTVSWSSLFPGFQRQEEQKENEK